MTTKTIVGLTMILLFGLLMIVSFFKKNETYFNIRETITLHLSLFNECKSQYIVFYGFPLLFAVGLALIYEAEASFYSETSVIIGILLSMLLAILSILSGFDFSTVKNESQKDKVKKVVSETINAIIFDTILCIFMMIYGLAIIVISGLDFSWISIDLTIIKAFISGTAYYVFIVILLTLFLIVKHMSKIIKFKDIKSN